MKSWVLISAASCLLLLTFEQVSGATIQGKHQGINPVDLVTIGNETFYITPPGVSRVSESDAEKYCADDNMKLISFQTPEKWTMITEYLNNNGYLSTYTYWTSGKDKSGEWFWTGPDEPITYFQWAANEPNSNSSSNCMHFYQIYGWYDTDCNNKFNFICEF